MTVSEKAAYIKGLIEGMKIDTSDGEGKVISAMADLLEDLSLSVLDLEDETATFNDYVEELDEDLGAVEEELYCDCDCCDDDCDCCDDEDLYEIECPACHDTVYLDEDMLEEDGITCPNCGTELEFDFDGCDCGCCHGEDDTDADEKE